MGKIYKRGKRNKAHYKTFKKYRGESGLYHQQQPGKNPERAQKPETEQIRQKMECTNSKAPHAARGTSVRPVDLSM
jgi:hypothetical protein